MFFSSLRAPLVALVAYLAVVSSAPSASTPPSLTVKTSTSDLNINGLENLKVTTTVVNTGGESIKLLNDPRGVLDPFPENSFTFTNPSGPRPSFVGARASYNSTLAAGLDDPSAFTVLAPGGSVNVTHDLSAAYDFTRSGTREYSIEPSNLFTYIDADGTPKDLYATVGDIAKVKLSGNLGVSGRVHNRRNPVFHCQRGDRQLLERAIDRVHELSHDILPYLDTITSRRTVTQSYRLWFGRYYRPLWQDIRHTYEAISNQNLFDGVSFSCLKQHRQRRTGPTTAIYFEGDSRQTLYVLPMAFNGTFNLLVHYMVHQATHQLNDGIKDEGFGADECVDLARFYPGRAALNAENYACFLVNVAGHA